MTATKAQRIVRYDPMLPTAAIFGSLGTGPRPKLDARCEFGGVVWRLRGPDMLGVPEQTLLLVLLEMAAEQYRLKPAGEGVLDTMERTLIAGIDIPRPSLPVPYAGDRPVVSAAISASYGELVRRCGRHDDGGNAARQVRRELERLCEVTVWAEVGAGVQLCSRLLGWRRGERKGVQVVLNWRLTEILVGRQFSPVSLAERLSLKSDIARALHCALSVRIQPGATMRFRLDTLAPYVWPMQCDAASSTVRGRRRQLRVALADIDTLPAWGLNAPSQAAREPAVVTVTRRRTVTAVRAPSLPRQPRAVLSGQTLPEGVSGTALPAPVDASGLFG